MSKRMFVLVDSAVRQRAASFITHEALCGYVVEVKPATRNLEQNSALWPCLAAFAEQLEWPVNGKMVKLSSEEWKAVLTAGFRKEQGRLAMGLDGGVVMLGSSTRVMSKAEFSEFLEFIHFVAADRGVKL